MSRYRASWTVVTDDKNDGPAVVRNGSRTATPDPTPFPGAIYNVGNDFEFGSYAKTPSIQLKHRKQNENHWTVDVEWGPAQEKEETNPLFEPVKYRLDAVTYTVPADVDRDGDAIVNAAGQPFEEKASKAVIHPVLVARKNFATLEEIIVLNRDYGERTNSDPYLGEPADHWLCHAITSSEIQSSNGVEFYTGYFRLEYNPDTWQDVFVNRGFSHYVSAGNQTLKQAEDADGNLLGEPVNLETNGTRASDTANANTIQFFLRKQVAFSGLPV